MREYQFRLLVEKLRNSFGQKLRIKPVEVSCISRCPSPVTRAHVIVAWLSIKYAVTYYLGGAVHKVRSFNIPVRRRAAFADVPHLQSEGKISVSVLHRIRSCLRSKQSIMVWYRYGSPVLDFLYRYHTISNLCFLAWNQYGKVKFNVLNNSL